MIDLVFNDSVKAAITAAGISPAAQVESLWLELSVGDISVLPKLSCREDVMRSVLAGPEGADDMLSFDALWKAHSQAVSRIIEAAQSGEPVRIWWSDAPSENCGFHFAASLLESPSARVTSVKLPAYFERNENICVYDSLSSVPPELLRNMLPLEQQLSPALRLAAVRHWRELISENAPLRAVVNGRLISVPADFYDYTLRRFFPNGEFTIAYAIGKTMGMMQLGVHDWWYAQRIRAMIAGGELNVVELNRNFYYTRIIKSA